MRRYFCGEAAKEADEEEGEEEEEAAAEAEADNGVQRRRFGEAGLSSGSKCRVRFKVAPQAMAELGEGRTRKEEEEEEGEPRLSRSGLP